MARQFEIPVFYRSPLISGIKRRRKVEDARKVDYSPSVIDEGRIRFKLARHFGFCFGVENAIEIAYKALSENPQKRIFLLSEMIHNPHVNMDLKQRGVRFLLSPEGKQLVPFEELKPDDIVIVPAFGTTVQLFERLKSLGINPFEYNATCPFVEKVWKRAAQLAEKGYTIIIHGKDSHEETKATFSHASQDGLSLVIRDLAEAQILSDYILGERKLDTFPTDFSGRYSQGFDPVRHLERIGVVNQTTMLATETHAISTLLKSAMEKKFGSVALGEHFADTRDTLCYATSENQDSIYGLLRSGGDLAIIVGGYNSSNTSHLVELCERQVPTFYIKDADEILSLTSIRHLDLHSRSVVETTNWLPLDKAPLEILLSAGASCPDALVDQVIIRVAELMAAGETTRAAFQSYARAES